MCPICFNEFDLDICGNLVNIAITKCNHKFCLSCIIQHGKRKYTCPICRGEFISPSIISPLSFLFNGESSFIEEEQIIMNNNDQSETEINNWYYGPNQEFAQEPLLPRINITYDSSNVTFSYRDENIRNLSTEPTLENNLNNDIHIYPLNNSIYDEAISLGDSTDNEDNTDENEGASNSNL